MSFKVGDKVLFSNKFRNNLNETSVVVTVLEVNESNTGIGLWDLYFEEGFGADEHECKLWTKLDEVLS